MALVSRVVSCVPQALSMHVPVVARSGTVGWTGLDLVPGWMNEHHSARAAQGHSHDFSGIVPARQGQATTKS